MTPAQHIRHAKEQVLRIAEECFDRFVEGQGHRARIAGSGASGNPVAQRVKLGHDYPVVLQKSPQIGITQSLLTRIQIQMWPQRDGTIAVRSGGFHQLTKVRLPHRPATETEIFWAE